MIYIYYNNNYNTFILEVDTLYTRWILPRRQYVTHIHNAFNDLVFIPANQKVSALHIFSLIVTPLHLADYQRSEKSHCSVINVTRALTGMCLWAILTDRLWKCFRKHGAAVDAHA